MDRDSERSVPILPGPLLGIRSPYRAKPERGTSRVRFVFPHKEKAIMSV